MSEVVFSTVSTEPQNTHDPRVTDLLKVVQHLTHKVSQLELALTKINADTNRTARGRASSTKGNDIVTRLNEGDGSLPSMNMDAFIDFLTHMPYEVESIISKKSTDVIADLVSDGCQKIHTRQKHREGMALPIASFADCPSMLFIFDDDKWQICSPALFSRFTVRFHVCVMMQCDRWRNKNVGPPRPLRVVAGDTKMPARDPCAVAKHHKISTKIYSLNLSSTRLMARTKSLVCAAAAVEDNC
jgi:hypothetical protein